MKIPAVTKKYETMILTTAFLIGLAVIFGTFFADFGLGESGYNFIGKTKKITLSPGEPVTQTFTAHDNGLYQLRIVLGNTDLQQDESIALRLLDGACRETIATDFRRESRKQGAYTVFSFPVLSDSRDKQYCFSATYDSPENRKGDKPYLSAIDEPDIAFADRTLTDSGKGRTYPSQSLFLRPAYTQGNTLDDIWELENRLSQYKPAFVKGSMLALGTFSVLFSLGFFLWVARKCD